MSALKRRIENQFERMGYWICRHRIKTLLGMGLIIALFMSQLPKLTIDTSFEGMLHEKDPARLAYNRFRDDFGQDRIVIVTVKTPDIFNETSLLKLKNLHRDFEEKVPHLDEVKSLLNARVTRGEGDTLVVGELLEGWPEKKIDLAAVRSYALGNPVYLNDFISEDGRIAAFLIRPRASVAETDQQAAIDDFLEDSPPAAENTAPDKDPSAKRHYLSKKENREVVEAVKKIVEHYETADFNIAYAGGPVSEEIYDRTTKENMATFRRIMMGIILVLLFMLFRRISGAFYPLIIVYASLFSTLGVMAMCNVAISVFSVILPTFLMAVGIADAVHILAIFYRQFEAGKEKIDAIASALGHSGVAIVMTSLTTAAGLLSFSLSEIAAIGYLGIFAAVGTTMALIYTLILLPAFLALTPFKRKTVENTPGRTGRMDRVLLFFADLSVSRPRSILSVCLLLFILAVAGMTQLRFAYNNKENFPETLRVRQDLEFIDKNLKGITSVEMVIETGEENGIYRPELLRKMEQLRKDALAMRSDGISVGKVRSINDILKETHQALNGNDPRYYAIPEERALIAQELFLFENSGAEDLEKIVDNRFSRTRVSMKVPWPEAMASDRFIEKLHDHYKTEMAGIADVSVTGMLYILGDAVTASIRSMSKSYFIAFFVISVLMIILVGDLKLGLLSMIPNLFPIFLVMGCMGAFGVTVDLVALMIGSIAIGLVVDDTMHFMYNYRRYYDLKDDSRFAVRETLLTTGRALLITSLVLAAGFFVLLFADLNNTNRFGFFTGIVVLLALLADFILAPALMVAVAAKRTSTSRSRTVPSIK